MSFMASPPSSLSSLFRFQPTDYVRGPEMKCCDSAAGHFSARLVCSHRRPSFVPNRSPRKKKKNSVNPVELGRNPGRSIWRAIVRPPRGKKAVRPLRPSAVVDSSGRSERCNKRDKRAPTRFQMARRYDPNTRQQQL